MSGKRETTDGSGAVVDRIVDGIHAVLLGEDEIEQVIPIDQLPDYVSEGVWLLISRDDEGQVATIEVDEDSTAEVKERIVSKLDKLRRRGRRRSGNPSTD